MKTNPKGKKIAGDYIEGRNEGGGNVHMKATDPIESERNNGNPDDMSRLMDRSVDPFPCICQAIFGDAVDAFDVFIFAKAFYSLKLRRQSRFGIECRRSQGG